MTNVTKIQWINMDDLVAIAMEVGQELLKNRSRIPTAHSPGNYSLLARAWKLIRCDRDSILEKAIRKSYDSLVKGLQKLTPDIPFLSSLDHDIPYSVRKSWNHLWLIDPLNGNDQYTSGNDNFCLSFSLVQAGEPIMGVIYNPKTGIVHYAKRGKGAYLKAGNNDPVKLEKPSKGDECPNGIIFGQQQLNIDAAERYLKKTYPEVRLITQTIPVSKTLAFSLILNGEADILFMAEPTWEWETGAAQIILKETGKNLYDFATKEKNRYNKPDLKNNSLIVR
jgi:3'(2'), 5'-bisphosphate nucleotidase